jgi:spore germination protein KC
MNFLLKLLFCIILPLLLSGCWDARELQQRSIVLMIGIDPSEQDVHSVKVSVQLARPQKFSTPPKPTTISGEESTVMVSENGVDVSDAIRKIQLDTDRRLYFEHVRAVVLNQEIAKRGTLPIIGSMVQARVAARDAWLFISENPAWEVLQYAPALDAIPSTYLTNFFESRLLLNRSTDATLGGFHQRLVTPGIDPFAIWIGRGDKELSAPKVKGIAAFSGDRFVGGLNKQQALGWQFVENQFPKSLLTFTCPKKNSGKFVLNLALVKSSVRVKAKNPTAPRAVVHVRVTGAVGGGICVNQTNERELNSLTKQVRDEVKTMVNTSIEQSQKLNTDIFGMGRNLYRFSPRDWRGDNEWNQTFRKVKTIVQVDVHLDFLQTYKKLGEGPVT